jgi:hypothetical protein
LLHAGLGFDLGACFRLDTRIAGKVRWARLVIFADIGADGVGEEAWTTHLDIWPIGDVLAGVHLLPVETHVDDDYSFRDPSDAW